MAVESSFAVDMTSLGSSAACRASSMVTAPEIVILSFVCSDHLATNCGSTDARRVGGDSFFRGSFNNRIAANCSFACDNYCDDDFSCLTNN